MQITEYICILIDIISLMRYVFDDTIKSDLFGG